MSWVDLPNVETSLHMVLFPTKPLKEMETRLLHSMVEEKVCSVDIQERTVKGIWKSSEPGELNLTSRLD